MRTLRASGRAPDFAAPFCIGRGHMCPHHRAVEHLNQMRDRRIVTIGGAVNSDAEGMETSKRDGGLATFGRDRRCPDAGSHAVGARITSPFDEPR